MTNSVSTRPRTCSKGRLGMNDPQPRLMLDAVRGVRIQPGGPCDVARGITCPECGHAGEPFEPAARARWSWKTGLQGWRWKLTAIALAGMPWIAFTNFALRAPRVFGGQSPWIPLVLAVPTAGFSIGGAMLLRSRAGRGVVILAAIGSALMVCLSAFCSVMLTGIDM